MKSTRRELMGKLANGTAAGVMAGIREEMAIAMEVFEKVLA